MDIERAREAKKLYWTKTVKERRKLGWVIEEIDGYIEGWEAREEDFKGLIARHDSLIDQIKRLENHLASDKQTIREKDAEIEQLKSVIIACSEKPLPEW